MRARHLIGALAVLFLVLGAGEVGAVAKHDFSCKKCHDPAVTMAQMGATNLCQTCHNDALPAATFLTRTWVPTVGNFETGDASNALVIPDIPIPVGDSHRWAGKDVRLDAGASAPPNGFYYSRYGVSKGKVTCTRCHQPHEPISVANPYILRPVTNLHKEICTECHAGWTIDNPNATVTHPAGILYSAYTGPTNDPLGRFRTSVDATNEGNAGPDSTVGLVDGMVLCGSCHQTHYADSDATATGNGDGFLLRSDGVQTVGADPIATAQRHSNLCQACHIYKMHGKTASLHPIGCLDCHSGHAYKESLPNVYVLRYKTTAWQPKLPGSGLVTFQAYTAPYNPVSSKVWSDLVATDTGFCEQCHGDVESGAVLNESSGHNPATAPPEGCISCHLHSGAYSWEPTVTSTGCSDCHGFPPYINSSGNSSLGGTPGGYGYISPTNNYATSGTNLNETTTPHNTHAGGGTGLGNSPSTDYKFTGSSPCEVCHYGRPNHNSGGTGTYQSINFSSLPTASGALIPLAYNTSGYTCSVIYCHSNGGNRTAAGGRNNYITQTTPSWNAGDAKIVGQTTPTHNCAFCHGNTSALMTSRSNTPAHYKHLDRGIGCNVCHVQTAASNTALQTTARVLGTHVNGSVNVDINSAYTLRAAGNTLGTGAYTGGSNGTCSVYCHSNGTTRATPTGTAALAALRAAPVMV